MNAWKGMSWAGCQSGAYQHVREIVGAHLSNILRFDSKRNRACATALSGGAISLPSRNSAFWLLSVKLDPEIEVSGIYNQKEFSMFRLHKNERLQSPFPDRISMERDFREMPFRHWKSMQKLKLER